MMSDERQEVEKVVISFWVKREGEDWQFKTLKCLMTEDNLAKLKSMPLIDVARMVVEVEEGGEDHV